MRKSMLCLLAVGFYFPIIAAERTWTGGGSDANWSTADNWGGTAPVAGDSLVFDGATGLANTNDFSAGTSFTGIKFNSGAGSFVLDGNKITLAGELISEDDSYQTIDLPIELSSDITVSNNVSGGRFVINGHISGSGGITKDGNDDLYLTASNSYDGATLIRRGDLVMQDAYACGSTNGITTVNRVENETGVLVIDGDGMDIYEPIEFRNVNADGSCMYTKGGSNTLHSTFTIQGGRYHFSSGTTLVFKQGVSPIGNPFFVINGDGNAIFEDKVDIGTQQVYADSPTKVYLNVSSNIWESTTLAGGEMIMNAVNALPANANLRLAVGYKPTGTLNLNGYDQILKYIYHGTTDPGTKVVKSDTPAILTLTDSGTREFIADFKGAVGLRKGGSGNFTLTGTGSDTTGSFIVDAGTLTVADGSSLGNSTNVVVNDSVLHIKGNAALDETANVFLNGSGYMNIESNLFVNADSLSFDGVTQTPGEWGSTESGAENVDDAHFQGGGTLIVTGTGTAEIDEAVWDAEAVDENLTTAENWVGDAAPAFDGFETLIFGSAGSSSIVDTAVSVHGLEFNRGADFALADGSGSLTVGAGGILAESTNAASRTYSIEENVALRALNSEWTVNRNGAPSVILDISGDVSSADWLNETRVTGDGRVNLSGDNSFAGDFVVETACVVNVYSDNALGSTNGSTTVENGGLIQLYGGINVAEDITLYGDLALSYQGAFRSNGGSNVWSGTISCRGSRVRVNSGSLDILGGVTHGSFITGASSGTHLRVAEKPISLGSGAFYPHSSGGPIIIATTNNTASQANVNGSELRFDVVHAFNTSIRWDINNNGGTVNLNGNDQEIGRLLTRSATPSPGTGRVYSDTPATLTVNQNSGTDYRNAFEGALSLVKQGTSELRLYGIHSTTGTLTVAEGTLTLKSGSSFDAVPMVTVTGGTLSLEDETTINDAAILSIEGSGVVDVDAGLIEEVGELFIDGSQKSAGTWGATGSGAKHIDDTHFSGSGVVKVLHDNAGTMIIIH